jgi:hypothetical protein
MVRAFGVVVQLFWWPAVVGAVYGLYRRAPMAGSRRRECRHDDKGDNTPDRDPCLRLATGGELAPSAHIRAS